MNDRVLAFPDDVAVGHVSARVGETWVVGAPARGRVGVPTGAEVHLWVSCPVRGLGMLRGDDVYALSLSKKAATDADMGRLAHLTGLRELHASKSHDVTDAGLAALAPLRRLRVLDLYGSAVTDDGLLPLSGMPELEHLHLGRTRLNGRGLVCLAGLQRLRILSVEDTDVDDAAVRHLVALRALRRLALSGTRVTTWGLAELSAGLPALDELWMPRPGRRVARERAQAAVLAILARRLDPALGPDASPEEALRALLPAGSRLVEARFGGGPPVALGWELEKLDVVAASLPRLGVGTDVRIVTPNGLDVWVPWLRARQGDRRRRRPWRRASPPPAARGDG
jgi:hypothetical protein